VLRVPKRRDLRNDDGTDRAQLANDFSRVCEPSYMGVAGREPAVRPWPSRGLLYRKEHLYRRLVEAAEKEIRDADHSEVRAPTVARAEAERSFDMLDCEFGLSRPDPQRPAQIPPASEARI